VISEKGGWKVMLPEYPIKIVFEEFEETWVLKNEEELTSSLEWFDSDSTEEPAIVTDSRGRDVKMKVENLKLLVFELK
jgi:hypothetical protein